MDGALLYYVATILTYVLMLALSVVVPWSVLGAESLPGESSFGLIVLFDLCILAGKLVRAIPIPKVPPLPPLLGMLIAGVALRNIPYINVAKDIDPSWSSALRSIALVVILLKAGLELDASSLRTMKGVCLRLTIIPCCVEALTCCLAAYLILGFSWKWGLLLGFVLGAVTPAIIVPCLLLLQQQGYGVAEGIPSLVIAASSFDDVLAITGFSVVLGLIFSSDTAELVENLNGTSTESFLNATTSFSEPSPTAGQIALLIARGPLEMLGGIFVGLLFGYMLWHLPTSLDKHVVRNRTFFVVGLGIVSVFGTRRAGVPGSGALAAIVTAFVAAYSWKETKQHVSDNISLLWVIFEPLLFGLIGADVDFNKINADTIGGGIGLLMICLVVRVFATFLSTLGTSFDLKEKIFICIAWIPKATVQAAIGPNALDTARNSNAPESIHQVAQQILTITVLCILITAPIGAAAIVLTGPRLLKKSNVTNDLTRTENELEPNEQSSIPLVKQTSATISQESEEIKVKLTDQSSMCDL